MCKRGFTLIELLIVVLILGILAGIGTPMFIRSVEESRSAEATATLSAYAYSQERHYEQFGHYTENISDLDIGFGSITYFTITKFGRSMTLTRNKDVGGSLGQWSITMTLPEKPGTDKYAWECEPMPACRYLIPSNQTGGASKA